MWKIHVLFQPSRPADNVALRFKTNVCFFFPRQSSNGCLFGWCILLSLCVSFGRSKGESIQSTGTKRNGTGDREHTLLHDRDVLLSGGHLESKLVTESNRMRILLTHLVGIAGSRRAFESCRVGVQSRKLLSQVLPQQSGRPTLVRFGRTKRNQATYVSLGLA
jgi:hypothetical protein